MLLPSRCGGRTRWSGVPSGVTIPILCSFCIFVGGKNWPVVKKKKKKTQPFDHFYVRWVFSLLSPKKRSLTLITVVGKCDLALKSHPQEDGSQPQPQHGPHPFSLFFSSLITKRIRLRVLLLCTTKKKKRQKLFFIPVDRSKIQNSWSCVSLKKPGLWDRIILKNFL